MDTVEIHIFVAVGASTEENEAYEANERHALHIFLRQETGEDHSWDNAIGAAENAGWREVEISRGGTLDKDEIETKEPIFQESYTTALEDGHALIVYSDVLD